MRVCSLVMSGNISYAAEAFGCLFVGSAPARVLMHIKETELRVADASCRSLLAVAAPSNGIPVVPDAVMFRPTPWVGTFSRFSVPAPRLSPLGASTIDEFIDR